MTERKIFTDSRGRAMFVCPACDASGYLDVAAYRHMEPPVRFQHVCIKCGEEHTIRLERRTCYRIDTHLPGRWGRDPADLGMPLIILDLSRTGFKARLEDDSSVKEGERIFVELNLPGGRKARRAVVVRAHFPDHVVGAEFTEPLDLSPEDVA